MRLWSGLLAVSGLALVVALPGRDAARPLTLDGPTRQAKEPIAFVWRDDGARLARVDERTLVRSGPLGPRLGYVDSWALAQPGGTLLALASHPDANVEQTRDVLR